MLRLGWGGVANWSEGKRAARVDCTRLAQNHVKYSMKWCRRHKWYQVKYQHVTLFRQASKIENHFFSLKYVLGGSPQSRLWVRSPELEVDQSYLPNSYPILNSLGWANPQTRFRGPPSTLPFIEVWNLPVILLAPLTPWKLYIYVVHAINPIVVL
jgi:uncharacterized protein (DUF2132 family)